MKKTFKRLVSLLLLLLTTVVIIFSSQTKRNVEASGKTVDGLGASLEYHFTKSGTNASGGGDLFVSSVKEGGLFTNEIDINNYNFSPSEVFYATIFIEITAPTEAYEFSYTYDTDVIESVSIIYGPSADLASDNPYYNSLWDEVLEYVPDALDGDDVDNWDGAITNLMDNKIVTRGKTGKINGGLLKSAEQVALMEELGRTGGSNEYYEGDASGFITFGDVGINPSQHTINFVGSGGNLAKGKYIFAKLKFTIKDQPTKNTFRLKSIAAITDNKTVNSDADFLTLSSDEITLDGPSSDSSLDTTLYGETTSTVNQSLTKKDDTHYEGTIKASANAAYLSLSVTSNGTITTSLPKNGNYYYVDMSSIAPGGDKEVEVTGTSNSGVNPVIYKIKIKKSLRTDNTLTSVSLTASGDSTYIEKSSVTSFPDTVKYSSLSSSIAVTPVYPTNVGISKVEVNGQQYNMSNPSPINVGLPASSIIVKVYAEDSTPKEYTINLSKVTIDLELKTVSAYFGKINIVGATKSNDTWSATFDYSYNGSQVSTIYPKITCASGNDIQFTTPAQTLVSNATTADGDPTNLTITDPTASYVVRVINHTTGDYKDWNIVLTRNAPSSNTNVTSISVTNTSSKPYAGSLNKPTYTVSDQLECTDVSVKIAVILQDSNAKWSFDNTGTSLYASGNTLRATTFDTNKDINTTSWNIPIYIYSQAYQPGDTPATYNVSITRKAPSDDTSLKTLKVVDNVTPSTNKAYTTSQAGTEVTYVLNDDIAYAVATLTVTPTVNESHAVITYDGSTRTSGQPFPAFSMSNVTPGTDFTIEFTVTAQDTTTVTRYIIQGHRKEASTDTEVTFNVTSTKGSSNYLANTQTATSSAANPVKTYTLNDSVKYTVKNLYVWAQPTDKLSKVYYLGTASTDDSKATPTSTPWADNGNKSSEQTWDTLPSTSAHQIYFVFRVVAEAGNYTTYKVVANIEAGDPTNTISINFVGSTTGKAPQYKVTNTTSSSVETEITVSEATDTDVRFDLSNILATQSLTIDSVKIQSSSINNGEYSLTKARGPYGSPNTLTIVVEPEVPGNTFTYIYKIQQNDTRNPNANLGSLTLKSNTTGDPISAQIGDPIIIPASGTTPAQTKIPYTFTVPYEADTYTLEFLAAADSNPLTVTTNATSMTKGVLAGNTDTYDSSKILSTTNYQTGKTYYLWAENKTVSNTYYAVTINRTQPSKDYSLKDLKINGNTIGYYDSNFAFTTSRTNYLYLVLDPTLYSTVTFDAVKNDKNATIVGTPQVVSGTNNRVYKYNFDVQAQSYQEDGVSHQQYQVSVYLASKDKSLNDVKIYTDTNKATQKVDDQNKTFTFAQVSTWPVSINYKYEKNSFAYFDILANNQKAEISIADGTQTNKVNGHANLNTKLDYTKTTNVSITVISEFGTLVDDATMKANETETYNLALSMTAPDTNPYLATFKVFKGSDGTQVPAENIKGDYTSTTTPPKTIVVENLGNESTVRVEFTTQKTTTTYTVSLDWGGSNSGTVLLKNGYGTLTINTVAQDEKTKWTYAVELNSSASGTQNISAFTVNVHDSDGNLENISGYETGNPIKVNLEATQNYAKFDYTPLGNGYVLTELYEGSTKIDLANGQQNNGNTVFVYVENGKTITLTAQGFDGLGNKGTERYTFEITRDNLSSDALLTEIRIKDTTTVFEKLTPSQDQAEKATDINIISLPHTEVGQILTLSMTKSNPNSTIDGTANTEFTFNDNSPLVTGNNYRIFKVVAQDGTTTNYYRVNVFVMAEAKVTDIIVENIENGTTKYDLSTPFAQNQGTYDVIVNPQDTTEQFTLVLPNDGAGLDVMIDAGTTNPSSVTLKSSTGATNGQLVKITVTPLTYDGKKASKGEATYDVTVYRRGYQQGKDLLTLSANGVVVDEQFVPGGKYFANLGRGTNSVELSELTSSPGSTIQIQSTKYNPGDVYPFTVSDGKYSEIIVSVIPEDKTISPNKYYFYFFAADNTAEVANIELLDSKTSDAKDVMDIIKNEKIVDFNKATYNYEGTISYSTKQSYVKVKVGNSNEALYIDDGDGAELITVSSLVGGKIITYDYSASTKKKITIYTISEYDKLVSEINPDYKPNKAGDYVIDIDIKAPVVNGNLKELYVTVNGEVKKFTVTPNLTTNDGEFIENTPSSKYYIPNLGNNISSVYITAVPMDAGATVKGDGTFQFKSDNDSSNSDYIAEATITCTPELGETQTYNIVLTRGVINLDDDNTIVSIELSGSNNVEYVGEHGTFKVFDQKTEDYSTVSIPYGVQSVSFITTILKGSKATVQFREGNNNPIQLDSGTKQIQITSSMLGKTYTYVIYALNQKQQPGTKYTFTVKYESGSADSSITELTVNNTNASGFSFDALSTVSPNEKAYYITVDYDTAVVRINATKHDPKSNLANTYLNRNLTLVVGQNSFDIVCVPEDNSEPSIYKVIITRRPEDPYIESLKLTNGTLFDADNNKEVEFDKDTKKYTVRLKYAYENETLIAHLDNIEFGLTASNIVDDLKWQTTPKSADTIAISNNIEPSSAVTVVYTVTSNGGGHAEYQITLVRAGKETADASVMTMDIDGLNSSKKVIDNIDDFNFLTNEFNYGTFEVANKVKHIDVDAIPAQSIAKISVFNNENLKVGMNTVIVVCESEDGSTQNTYTISVLRAPMDWDVDTNAYDSMKTNEVSNKSNYTVEVGKTDVTTIDWTKYITYDQENNEVDVEVVSAPTKDSNQVVLKVTDGTETSYVTLNLSRKKTFLEQIGTSWWVWAILLADVVILTAILISVNRDKYGKVTKKRKEI
ncbi:MAG: cadherin-like beta sandwich domain-containing protein [Acholeplasmatales bacterium]|nr:cadherin-like beta sandwich domain-containing protein [Acholeplasmatales bacterium]